MSTPKSRLEALQRKFRKLHKPEGLLIQHPHAGRYRGAMVCVERANAITDALVAGWKADKKTADIFLEAEAAVPDATRVEMDLASRWAADKVLPTVRHGPKRLVPTQPRPPALFVAVSKRN